MEKVFYGKTDDEAIAKACAELGVERDEISCEIVEVGSKGFFGIGAKDYAVKVTYGSAAAGHASAGARHADGSDSDPCVVARNYLEGLFALLGINDAAMDITYEDRCVNIQVTGEDAEMLMHHHGEGVDALQLIVSLIVNRDCGEYFKVSFNVNDYKEKTKNRLEALAVKTAAQVVKNRRKVTLPPMTSFQRRIIHSKLQDYPDVKTYSIGEDPSRRVVVSYEGADGPAPRKEGGRGGNRGGYRKDGNRNGNRGGNGGFRRDGNRGGRSFDRKPRAEYVPEGEIYTGAITHLPGEKLSGANAKNGGEAGAGASPVTGGTPFTMDQN